MKYKELIAQYQADLLTEKDINRYQSGFDGIGKLSRTDTVHMNVTAKKDSNEYRPYNANTKQLSGPANQALMRVDKVGHGTRHPISDNIANEILMHYNRGSTNSLDEEMPKAINSKSRISIVRSNGKIYLQKD